MCDDEINKAIAEALGNQFEYSYTTDAPVRAALLTLSPSEQDRYAAILGDLTEGRRIDYGATRIEATTKILFASARVQAEAFCRVKGLWKE